MKAARQGREQRVERPTVAAQEAAHDRGAPRRISEQEDVVALGSVAGDAGNGSHAGRAGHHVRVSVREDDHVSRSKLDLALIGESAEAAAPGDNVIRDEMLSAREDAGRELVGPDHLDAPGRGGLDGVEECAVQANHAEEVGERIAQVALGLVAYAVYELLNARYRRMP